MRYAIVSDLHANLEAWQRVFEDIHAVGADTLICLGDIVGYGPKPQEVVDQVREVCANFVLGNHDAAVTGQLDASVFNDQARAVVEWTRGKLTPETIEFLAQIPLSIESEDILFVHAEAADPGRFHYIETPEDACENFDATTHRVTFIGHTHHPTAFVQSPDGEVIAVEDQDFQLESDHRYLINVGSAGEPRNPNDIRARYAIYDSDTGHLLFRRVEFDPEVYRSHLVSSGLQIQPFFLRVIDHQTLTAAQEHAMVRDMAASIRSAPNQGTPRRLVVSSMQVPQPAPRGTPTPADRRRNQVTTRKSNSPVLVIVLSICLALIGAGGFLLWKEGRLPWQHGPSFEELAALSQDDLVADAAEMASEDPSSESSAFTSIVLAETGESAPASATSPPASRAPAASAPPFKPVSPEQAKGAMGNPGFEAPGAKNKPPADWQYLSEKPVSLTGRRAQPFRAFKNAGGKQVVTLPQGSGLFQKLRGVPAQPYATYTFSFMQYEQTNLKNQGGGLRIELWEGNPLEDGELLASAEFPATGSGKSARRKATLTTPGNVIPGAPAYLVFRQTKNWDTGHSKNVTIDNVVLNSVAPAKPATP